MCVRVLLCVQKRPVCVCVCVFTEGVCIRSWALECARVSVCVCVCVAISMHETGVRVCVCAVVCLRGQGCQDQYLHIKKKTGNSNRGMETIFYYLVKIN